MQEIRATAAMLAWNPSSVWRLTMRGRRARPLDIAASDIPVLQFVAHSRSLPWFQVQHARILLAVRAGQRIQAVASQMQCDEATVWRLCRRYEQRGLVAVL